MALLRCFIFCSACALSSIVLAQPVPPQTENKAITSVLKSQFERPGSRLRVAPITIVDDRAVVGWVQGSHGGRALLQKLDGRWVVALCAGDALKEESELVLAGIDKEKARMLVAKINDAEARLPTSYLKQLSKFQGSVNMTADDKAR